MSTRKFWAVFLSAVIASLSVLTSFSTVMNVDAGDVYADATEYTYKITPILEPFEYYIYVETDNPDPYSFAFVDNDSVYTEDGDDAATYAILETVFSDVEYEDESIYRVNGGYIFYCKEGKSDGGELTLMQTTGIDHTGSTYYWGTGETVEDTYYSYADTGITVTAPDMVDNVDYLINNYTTRDQSLFEKLDAVSAALEEISVYPATVYDSDKPTGFYPALAAPYWTNLPLNAHYDAMYEEADGLLMSYAYPFVLDSLGYPGLIEAVAERLEPTVEVESTSYHHLISITFDGTTKEYGGAGNASDDTVIFTEYVDVVYTFTGSAGDFATEGTMESYASNLLSYKAVSMEDMNMYEDMVAGDTYYNTISSTGGTWLRVAIEGKSYGTYSYAYVVASPISGTVYPAVNAWVDGRYIGYRKIMEYASFEDYPTADIILHDVTYVDAYGNEHTQDVIYAYDSDTDTWRAEFAFHHYYSTDTWPDELILTREEVDAMDLDYASDELPEEGLIYDGTAYPGTPFVTAAEETEETEEESTEESSEVEEESTEESSEAEESAEESTEAEVEPAETSTEVEAEPTEESTEAITEAEEKSTEAITEAEEETTEVSTEAEEESTETSTEAEEETTEASTEVEETTEVSTEAEEETTEVSTEAEEETTEASTEAEEETTAASTEAEEETTAASTEVEETTEVSTEAEEEESTEVSTEAEEESTEVSTEAEEESTEASTEAEEETTSADAEDDTSADIDLGYLLGDVNGDGKINLLDADRVLKYDAELIKLDDMQLLAGDVNLDGFVDSLDAILILRREAGLISSF